MRGLAQELAVEAMSLYYYVANKDDLQSAMVDIVVADFEMPRISEDWRVDVRRSVISAHDVLRRHPWACGLMMSARGIGPPRLRYMEWLLGRLRRAGFSAELTHHAYHALDSHMIGSTLWQAGYSTIKMPPDFGRNFLRDLPDTFPYLVEHAEQHMAKRKANAVREFEFGLDLILDGLEKILSRTSRRPVSAQPRSVRARR